MTEHYNPVRDRPVGLQPRRVTSGPVSNGASPLLIVGLGNPGKEFEDTYHNVGAKALEYLRELRGAPKFKKAAGKRFAFSKSRNVIFVSPLAFMNESGAAIREALRYFRLKKDALIVIHDDTDLPLGSWKESQGRGAAGHRGVVSIITALCTKDFRRFRIGIRRELDTQRKKAGLPAEVGSENVKAGLPVRSPERSRRTKAGEFVLCPIAKHEQKTIERVFEEITQKILPNS